MALSINSTIPVPAVSVVTDSGHQDHGVFASRWPLVSGYVFYCISAAFLVFYCLYMCLNLLAIVNGYLKLHTCNPDSAQCNKTAAAAEWPGVTVIKPIIGMDKNLRENLESFFKLSYPKFELLFCVAEHDSTPSLAVIQELTALYPHIDVRVFMGAPSLGVNPKINNMFNAYQSALYNLLWISDSNIITRSDTLTELVSKVTDPNVALVHQLPYVSSVSSIADYLDKVYFGTQHARVYLWANLIGRNCVTGMSWIIKKSAVDKEGGLLAFSDYLAEDYFLGKALWNRGWKFVLSSIPALQNPGSRTLSSFVSRAVRWGRLRATMMPLPVLFEPFTECFLLGIIGSLTVHYIIGFNRLLFLLLHCLIWLTFDLILIHLIQNGPVSSIWRVLLVWLLRETCALPLYLASTCSREVTWRGTKFRLQLGGKATKID